MAVGIPKQCLSCRFEVSVNFREVFALFLGAFIVDFEYSLFIVNVIKCYLMAYLCGTRNRRYINGSYFTMVATVLMTSPMWFSSQIFVYKLL